MKRFARWLTFFVVGDLLMALGAMVAVAICAIAAMFLSAIWDGGFDTGLVGSLFMASLDTLPSPATAILVCLALPGLFGAFWLSRRSLDNDGWRFWRWRALD